MMANKPFVVLDAGHGGRDPGAVSGNWLEKDITLRLVHGVKDFSPTVLPILTRLTDVYLSLPSRIAIIKKIHPPPSCVLSIHLNWSGKSSANGYEFIYGGERGRILCQVLNQYFNPPLNFRGIKLDLEASKKKLAILRQHPYPAALVEAGFISNKGDMKYILGNLDEIAKMLARGIEKYAKEYVGKNEAGSRNTG